MRILPSPDQHRAIYDDDGNIIIPSFTTETDSQPETQLYEPPTEAVWEVVSDESVQAEQADIRSQLQRQVTLWQEFGERAQQKTGALVQEGAKQYAWSVQDTYRKVRGLRSNLKHFLTQPVWIITPKKEAKQYSRGTLFVLDVFRFGGTFAVIFGVLFASLNYQSFWEIAQEKINPIQYAQLVSQQTAAMDTKLRANLLKSPALATAGHSKGELLGYLPDVGPPSNRIIIPRLGLNIPLVTPSYESLLKEDWDQVETDIQDALQHGVVHYPGTARPGQAGNFFVTGHSSYYPWAPGRYKTIFARLHNLQVGDEYYVYYGGDKHRYLITEKKEVRPSNVDVLDQPLDQRMSTLMTCSPVGTTLRRLILTAQEIDVNTGVALEVGEQQQRDITPAKPEMLPI